MRVSFELYKRNSNYFSMQNLLFSRHDYKASFDSTWRSDLCITKHLMENITRCICPLSGTYVVMLTKKQPNVSGINLMCTRVENALDLWPLALFSNFMTFIFISFTLNLALHGCSCWQILLSIHIPAYIYIFSTTLWCRLLFLS